MLCGPHGHDQRPIVEMIDCLLPCAVLAETKLELGLKGLPAGCQPVSRFSRLHS